MAMDEERVWQVFQLAFCRTAQTKAMSIFPTALGSSWKCGQPSFPKGRRTQTKMTVSKTTAGRRIRIWFYLPALFRGLSLWEETVSPSGVVKNFEYRRGEKRE